MGFIDWSHLSLLLAIYFLYLKSKNKKGTNTDKTTSSVIGTYTQLPFTAVQFGGFYKRLGIFLL